MKRFNECLFRARYLAHRLRKERDGLAAVEFALLLPFLMAIIFGGITAYDAVRTRDRVELATSVVADMLSRQNTLDDTVLDRLHAFHAFLAEEQGTSIRLRVRAVSYELRNDQGDDDPSNDVYAHRVVWQYHNLTGTVAPPNPGNDGKKWTGDKILPRQMSPDEMAFVIDIRAFTNGTSFASFAAPDKVETRIVTFPRFVSQVPNKDDPNYDSNNSSYETGGEDAGGQV